MSHHRQVYNSAPGGMTQNNLVYNRIKEAYDQNVNPVIKNPVVEQQRVKKTSTLELLNPQTTITPRSQSVPQTTHNYTQMETTTPGLSQREIQLTQEIVKQCIQELGRQSPIILKGLLKEINQKAKELLGPVLVNYEDEKKQFTKTSVSSVVSPVDMLAHKISKYTENLKETVGVGIERMSEQLKIPTTYRYIDIDSTYRNRHLYPNPCSFVIPFTDAARKDSGLNADDPVFLGYPFVVGIVNTINGDTLQNFNPNPPLPPNYDSNTSVGGNTLQPNYYINYYIQIYKNVGITPGNDYYISKITGNTPSSGTFAMTIYPAITIATPNHVFRIRQDSPILANYLQAGGSSNTAVLSSDANPDYGYYDGCMIIFYYINDITRILDKKIITNYNGNTKVATLDSSVNIVVISSGPPLVTADPTAAGTPFEIVKFSYDNLNPLRYSGSRSINQAVCFDILLLHLVVPYNPQNNTLNVLGGVGGNLRNYPYLYVHFYNDNNHSHTTLYGNNPNADVATFKVTLDNPIFPAIQALQSAPTGQFLIFNNINVSAPQNLKLTTLESLRFRVTLPNGDDLIYSIPDYYSPLPPNPRVQFSAMIAINMK